MLCQRLSFDLTSHQIIAQALEGGDAESSGVADIFSSTSAADQSEAEDAFMRSWLTAIALEESGITHRRAQMWTMSGDRNDAIPCAAAEAFANR